MPAIPPRRASRKRAVAGAVTHSCLSPRCARTGTASPASPKAGVSMTQVLVYLPCRSLSPTITCAERAQRFPSPRESAHRASLLGCGGLARQRTPAQPEAMRKEARGQVAAHTHGRPAARANISTMSRQRDTFGPQSERRLALSGLIRQTLTSVEEREQQRGRLINVLILAQALLTLAIAPAHWGSPAAFALAAALAVYLLAFVANRLFNRPGAAAYILVFGGSLAVFAQALVAAVAGNPAGTAQAALFFITVVLEAGLLFSPEVTLIAAAASTIFTAVATLLAPAGGAPLAPPGTLPPVVLPPRLP